MVASDHAQSIQGLAFRITKLNASGQPISGTHSCWISDQFISVGFTPEYEAGDEVNQKAANGSLCATWKTKDVLKRTNVNVDICNPEPELTQLMVDGDLLAYTGDPTTIIGYAAPGVGQITTPNGVSLELWTRAVVNGRPAAVNPYWYWVFPYLQLQANGERKAENGLMANSFTGWGTGNALWTPGPDASWPLASGKPYQFARAASMPVVTNTWLA